MFEHLKNPERVLLGPGPSNARPNTLLSQALPLIGHMDNDFVKIMNETSKMLRIIYGTKNRLTMPISGTGSAGMETVCVNLIEPGDKVLLCINGVFGERWANAATRAGAEVTIVRSPWGEAIDASDVEKILKKDNFKFAGIVHAETSTGVRQPLTKIGKIAHEHGALFVTDSVTAIGGMPIEADKIGIDASFSGTQKNLSAPPGLAPITFGNKAVEAFMNRKIGVRSWYLDLNMITKYWEGKSRAYHHTAPISSIYAIYTALKLIIDEGLENVFMRHIKMGEALQKGLEIMGLTLFVKNCNHRLPNLTTVYIPNGIKDLDVRMRLLNEYNIEIGGGLGEYSGNLWRIGLMGNNCRAKNVYLVLSSLEAILSQLGHKCRRGAAVEAARSIINN